MSGEDFATAMEAERQASEQVCGNCGYRRREHLRVGDSQLDLSDECIQ